MAIEEQQTEMEKSGTAANFLYTVGEECLNTITHGVAALLSFIGAIVLVMQASLYGETAHVISMTVFGIISFLLYLFSTLYHSLSRTRANAVFQRFDHIAIYLMIAGTYTPISLCIIQVTSGWILFGLIWSLATLALDPETPVFPITKEET